MRYFYQLLIAFIVTILFTVSALGYSLLVYSDRQVAQQVESRLDQTASYLNQQGVDPDLLARVSPLLASTGTKVYLYDEQGKLRYPNRPELDVLKQFIPAEEITWVENGHELGLRPYGMNFTSTAKADSLAKLIPIKNKGQAAGFLVIGSQTNLTSSMLAASKHDLLLSLGLVVLITIGLATGFSYFLNYRLNRLRQATQKIAQGDYGVEIHMRGQDELNELAYDFNNMSQALVVADKEVQRQEKLRQQFLLDIAHEMRTPLTTMNGLLEGLRYHVIPDERRGRCLDILHSETQRLTRMVEQSMDIEKIRANEIYLHKIELKLAPFLEGIAEQLQGRAAEKDNKLEVSCPEHLTLWADRDRLRQIIVNITNNAIQFTEHGQIHLRAQAVDEAVQVEISDTGIGMSEEQLENIWERFYKVDESRRSTHYGESGLGLAIVKQLVQAHAAQIEVHSELGAGSSFVLTFPKKPQDSKEEEA